MKRILIFLAMLAVVLSLHGENSREGRAIWAHPGDLGKSEGEVEAFFELLEKCKINVVFPLVKNTGGAIFWQSRKFPEAIHPDYRDFDLLEAAVRFGHLSGIKVHPWLCDFPESRNSAAFIKHPEWAMLNPQGGNTSQEKLDHDRPYNPVWMCPARRPGYVDQWLIPMIEEIVRDYDVDGIHHDYVRYPGDVAPDSYCFCDHCLEHYLVYNHFYYPSRPHDAIVLKKVLPREEANWHNDLTLRPRNWDKMNRAEKADYLLNGKSVNRNDLDYYFYETRVDTITRFVKESTERARKIKPEIEISAAVFINPMRSARHIGQRWTDFAQWIDILAPMNYRSHFQGSFEDYLFYLRDYVKAQREWCGEQSALYPGITGHYIYREEREPWEKALEILESKSLETEGNILRGEIAKCVSYLERFSAEKAKTIQKAGKHCIEKKVGPDVLIDELRKVLSDPPPGFFPEEKLLQTIQAVREAGAEGVTIFAAGIITRNKLWAALEKAFSE